MDKSTNKTQLFGEQWRERERERARERETIAHRVQVVGDVAEMEEYVEGVALGLQRAHRVIPAIDAQVAHERHARRPVRERHQRAERVHLAPLGVGAALVDCTETLVSVVCIRMCVCACIIDGPSKA